jgi:hypothetical protein
MRFKACDEFAFDLFESGLHHSRTLSPLLAAELIEEFSNTFRGGDYKDARNRALDSRLLDGDEREAYKDFLDRFWQRRAQAARRERKERWRPFAPLRQ